MNANSQDAHRHQPSRQHQQSILHMLHFQYNYNASTVLTVRDRFCRAIFVKLSQCYYREVPHRARMAIQAGLFTMALLCFATLTYMHVAFVKSPILCLDEVSKQWAHDGILRVEVLRGPTPEAHTLESSYLKELAVRHNLGLTRFKFSDAEQLKNGKTSEDYLNSFSRAIKGVIPKEEPNNDEGESPSSSLPRDHLIGLGNRSVLLKRLRGNFTEDVEMRMLLSEFENFCRGIRPSKETIVEYSLNYGMLRLAPPARNRLKVPVHLVTLRPESDECFGDALSRFLLRHLVGYNDLLMGSVKRLAEKQNNKGYVKNVISGEHFRFVSTGTSHTSYISAALVMLTFTLSISTLMRYVHHQVFALVVDALHLLEFNSGRNSQTPPLFIVILALVGMEAIMSEFFHDTTTAYAIIFIVWLADQFEAVCCHSPVSKKHWPRFFFLYHFAFYAYDYRFNGQYSGLALTTSFFFILHSMVYFYHRFEMPAVVRAEDALVDVTELLAANNNNNSNNNHNNNQPSAELEPAVGPGGTGATSPQSTQFVISARVTVTRRVEAPSAATGDRLQEDNESAQRSPETRVSDDEGVDSNRSSPAQRRRNRTRKLSSCSSTQASSCGCCSSAGVSESE